MNTIDIGMIEEKISQLEEERAKFIQNANIQVERLTGAILGLRELLNPPVEKEQDENETDR